MFHVKHNHRAMKARIAALAPPVLNADRQFTSFRISLFKGLVHLLHDICMLIDARLCFTWNMTPHIPIGKCTHLLLRMFHVEHFVRRTSK